MPSIGVTVVDGDQTKDVQLDYEADDHVADLLEAIGSSADLPAAGFRCRVGRTGRLLAPTMSVAQTGVLHGDRLIIESLDSTSPSPAAVQLVRVEPAGESRILTLAEAETLVGRGVGGPGSLKLDDQTVSSAHATIVVSDLGIELVDHDSTNGTWVNGDRIGRSRMLGHGDEIRFGDESVFQVAAPWTRGAGEHLTARDGLLLFNRPPRRVLPSPERVISLPAAPDTPPSRRVPLPTMVVPVVLGVVIYLVTQNAMFLLFAGMGPLMAGWNWLDDRRSGRGKFRQGAEAYRGRLQQARRELADGRSASARWRAMRLPGVGALTDRALRLGDDLWDRRPVDDDFLHARLGSVGQPALVRLEVDDRGDVDLLAEARALAGEYQVDPDAPLPLRLGDLGIVGLSGSEAERSRLARWLVAQLACTHSPRDVAITVLASRDATRWDWIKWLPQAAAAHGWLGSDPLGDAGSVLRSVIDFGEHRREGSIEGMPRLLVVVEPDLDLSDADLRRALQLASNPASGLILLWLSSQRSRLPGECSATIEFGPDGRIGLDVGSLGTQAFGVDPDGIAIDDAEAMARALAPLRDPGAASRTGGIPDRVGLLEALGVDAIRTEDVADAWASHDGALRAPIGIDATGGVAFLDLGSAGDGPHGLVAGTTGAGKSEFLQSLVAALAYRYPPSHLTFLFVDYKGGSAFKDCLHLPHFVGQLTNLDEGLADRARRSLQAELVYRQRLFDKHGVKDLEELRRKFPDEAPPALLIVFDEFASLVDDVPEFVDGVVDIAEKGRSLGVHMILATQTPGGAINRKVQNCVNFRVALRLKEESESSDVIKSPEAVSIPSDLPGRGLVRLGSGDLVRFQSAYAGGLTAQTDRPGATARTMLFAGPRPDATQASVEPALTGTDLTEVVDAAAMAARAQQFVAPRRPWLHELPTDLVLDTLLSEDRPLPPTAGVVGLLDLPDHQVQERYVLDLAATPNVLVLGGSGMGKTTLLRTIAASLASSHSSDTVHVYAFDFAGRGLGPLEALPQVGGVARADEPSKVRSLLAMLAGAVQDRRRMIDSAGSAAAYRRSGGELTTIVVLVDGLLPLMMTLEDLDGGAHQDTFTQLVSEGPSAGIHFVIATDQPQRIPMTIGNSVTERLVLALPNQDAYYAAGVGSVPPTPLPRGRAISVARQAEVQIAVVASPGGTLDGVAQARHLSDLASRAGAGGGAPRLRVLADVVTPSAVEDADRTIGVVPLGVDDVALSPQSVDFRRVPTLLVMGPDLSGRSNALAWIRHALSSNGNLRSILIAPRLSSEIQATEWDLVFADPMSAIEEIEGLADDEAERLEGEWTLVALDDCDELLETPIGAPPEERQAHARYSLALDRIVRLARDRRYVVVAAGRFSALSRAQGWARRMQQNQQAIILAPTSLAGGYTDPVFNIRLPRRSDYRPLPGRGVLIRRADADLIQTVLLGGAEL